MGGVRFKRFSRCFFRFLGWYLLDFIFWVGFIVDTNRFLGDFILILNGRDFDLFLFSNFFLIKLIYFNRFLREKVDLIYFILNVSWFIVYCYLSY